MSTTMQNSIRWRLHLSSSPESVFDSLATDSGRRLFWAESSEETNSVVHFVFPDDSTLDARVLEKVRPKRYVIEYFGASMVTIELEGDGRGGTDLTLLAERVKHYQEELPGWVSVLMAMKGAVDFGVDLRNHDKARSWDSGYVDN